MSKKVLPVDYIGAALTIAEDITSIVEKSIPSEQIVLARMKLNEVNIIAKAQLSARRANSKANKAKWRDIELHIAKTCKGLDLAAKHGLSTDKLKANLQILVDMLSEVPDNVA